MDASHLCRTRTGGAQNWEAWIKDTRDNEYYRIVYMPDSKWWLAQNVKYAATGYAVPDCIKDECGRAYTYEQAYASYAGGSSGANGNVQGICPPGWLLPIGTTWTTFVNSISSTQSVVAQRLRAYDSWCTPVTDYYGFASIYGVVDGDQRVGISVWYKNEVVNDRHWGLGLDSGQCDLIWLGRSGNEVRLASIRCFRSL
jgi:uncharacterized protein (TIGR02145 family)